MLTAQVWGRSRAEESWKSSNHTLKNMDVNNSGSSVTVISYHIHTTTDETSSTFTRHNTSKAKTNVKSITQTQLTVLQAAIPLQRPDSWDATLALQAISVFHNTDAVDTLTEWTIHHYKFIIIEPDDTPAAIDSFAAAIDRQDSFISHCVAVSSLVSSLTVGQQSPFAERVRRSSSTNCHWTWFPTCEMATLSLYITRCVGWENSLARPPS